MNHFAIHLKLTQFFKLTILQFKKWFRKRQKKSAFINPSAKETHFGVANFAPLYKLPLRSVMWV